MTSMDTCLDTSSTGIYSAGGPLDWGNQRARVRVERPAEAVLAELPWRRHELPAHAAVVVSGPSGGRIDRAAVVGGSSETGLVAFYAGSAGEHFVYWLPYRQKLTGGTCEQSYLTTDGAQRGGAGGRRGAMLGLQFGASAWLEKHGLRQQTGGGGGGGGGGTGTTLSSLPRAQLLAMESRGSRFQRHGGELPATAAEVASLRASHGAAAPLLFAHQVHSATRVVRTDPPLGPLAAGNSAGRGSAGGGSAGRGSSTAPPPRVPMCWARAGPTRALRLAAATGSGQHVLVQVGVLAGRSHLTVISASLSSLRGQSSSMVKMLPWCCQSISDPTKRPWPSSQRPPKLTRSPRFDHTGPPAVRRCRCRRRGWGSPRTRSAAPTWRETPSTEPSRRRRIRQSRCSSD